MKPKMNTARKRHRFHISPQVAELVNAPSARHRRSEPTRMYGALPMGSKCDETGSREQVAIESRE